SIVIFHHLPIPHSHTIHRHQFIFSSHERSIHIHHFSFAQLYGRAITFSYQSVFCGFITIKIHITIHRRQRPILYYHHLSVFHHYPIEIHDLIHHKQQLAFAGKNLAIFEFHFLSCRKLIITIFHDNNAIRELLILLFHWHKLSIFGHTHKLVIFHDYCFAEN